MDTDIEQMKEVKSGKIDDEFFLWMNTNFGNFENGNILIEIEKYGNKYEKKVCYYISDSKKIRISDSYMFSLKSCKSWKLVTDDKDLYIVFSYVIYDDEFWYSSEYHTQKIFKIIKTSPCDCKSLL